VARIEGKFSRPVVLASGMDSVTLVIKLYDREGNLLTNVDSSDLTLSTSEDVEARPIRLKQGEYKTEILPRVKSKSIRMRIDWLERTFSQEIVLQTTTAPIKDSLELSHKERFQSPRIGDGRESAYPTDGFSLENNGNNRIVNTSRRPDSQRVFNFDYPEQARQNLSLEVYDSPSSTVSHTMHSLFFLFPRKNLFLAEPLTGTINVTLPTGEKMIFQKESKEIVAGVFQEGRMDAGKDKDKRSYPDLKYTGRGVVLRVNARGQSPQLGEYETDKIDLEFGVHGSVDVLILNGQTGEKCRRPKADFWDQVDVVPIEFKFPTDEEFDVYLRNNCGFGLPKF
jgi:hypothetical protein